MEQMETAAPTGTGHGGKDSLHTKNANRHTRKKQTACSRCNRLFSGVDPDAFNPEAWS